MFIYLFQTWSLGPPHGKCNVKKLPLHEYGHSRDVNYTFSRCTRECDTNNMLNSCLCRDAYMPGPANICNLTQFLDCSVPILCK